MPYRTKIPPPDFKVCRCKSCGSEIDFTYVVRKCVGCGRNLCRSCKWMGKDERSRCHKCHRAAFR